MDGLTKAFEHLSLPSRNEKHECISEGELNSSLEKLLNSLTSQSRERSLLMFRRLRELATSSNIISPVTIKLYESSLFYSLENDDFEGFTLSAVRLVAELYQSIPSDNKSRVISLLLLFYAIDVSREADFSTVFYRLSDIERSSEQVKYALSVFMALRRCDYVLWDDLVERADFQQAILLKVYYIK